MVHTRWHSLIVLQVEWFLSSSVKKPIPEISHTKNALIRFLHFDKSKKFYQSWKSSRNRKLTWFPLKKWTRIARGPKGRSKFILVENITILMLLKNLMIILWLAHGELSIEKELFWFICRLCDFLEIASGLTRLSSSNSSCSEFTSRDPIWTI